MKNFILNFKSGVRFFTSIIISREFAVIYCLLGTISQISHTYFLVESISSLDGVWRVTQATMLSVFISSSLFYFVAIADKNAEPEEYKKVMLAINLFTFMEIIINIYYYSRHLLIDSTETKIMDYVFAILLSCLIPITIKLYSSHVRAKEWIIAIEHEESALVDKAVNLNNSEVQNVIDIMSEDSNNLLSEEKILELVKPLIESFQEELSNSDVDSVEKINELIENRLSTLNNDIDKQISESYQRNQTLFLNQFENKLKLISQDYINKIKES